MKANQKFLRNMDEDDQAVSPVIAVILMVAITVVLAATVYVWVSGFGSQSSTPAKSMSFSSAGAIATNATSVKEYTVASATTGLKWSDITFTLDGSTLTYQNQTVDNSATDTYCVIQSGTWCASSAPTLVTAGQTLRLLDTSLSGQSLKVLDSSANSVILTLTVS